MIDSSIAMGVRPPQIENPLNRLAQIMQIQGTQNQNALAQYSLGKARRTDDETNALASLLQGGGIDLSTPEGQAQAFKAAPTVAPGMIKNFMEGKKMSSEIGKNDAEAKFKQVEAVTKAVAQHRDALAGVNDPQSAADWIRAAYQNPDLKPLTAATPLEAALSKIPADPAGFQTWRQQMALGATKYIEMNAPKTNVVNSGQTTQIVQTPGLGGAPSVAGTIQNTATPSALLADRRAAATLAETKRHNGITEAAAAAQTPAIFAPGQTGAAGPTGEEFLKTLSPQASTQVKALAEGRMAFPSGFALKSPYWQQMISAVSQYDPTFDAVNYNKRSQTANAFAKGKQADAIKSVNQTLSHMGNLSDAIDKLDNFNGVATPLNYVVNPAQKAFGDPRQGTFQQTVQAVSSELRKVFSSGGVGSLQELKQWEDSLPLNASKEQQTAYLKNGLDLLQGAMGALDNQYREGMGPKASINHLITPKARAVISKLDGTAAPGAAPAVGAVQGGYRFKGGNPAVQSSWEKI